MTSASQGSTWSKVWKNSYVKTAVLIVIIIGGVVGFWYGLQAGLRTQYPLLTVASGSMIPTLNVGDLIVVQGVTDYSGVKAGFWNSSTAGDIIVFHDPRPGLDDLIVHRAVSKAYNENDGLWYFRTAGDGNKPYPSIDHWSGTGTWDGMISELLFVGKVVGKVPWVGYIPLTIRRPEGMLIIVVLFLIIILMELIPSTSKKPEAKQS